MFSKKAEESYRIGLEFFNKGKLEMALKHFNDALNEHPANSKILSDKGAVLAKLGKYEEALETLDNALFVDPNLVNAITNKNFVLKKLGKSKQLGDEENNLLEEFKGMHHHGLFNALGKEIKFMMDLIYQIDDPERQVTLYGYYKSYIDTKDKKYLMFIFEALGRLFPNNLEAWNLMMQAYMQQGLASAAILTLKHFLDKNPNDLFKWNMLGVVYSMLKQPEKGLECYQKQMEINPELHKNLINLSLCFEDLGDKDRAIEYAKKYAAAYPNDLKAQAHLKRLVG